MKDGYNLVNFTKIHHDKKHENVVIGVEYETVAYLGTEIIEEEVFEICKRNNLEFSILMIVKVEDGKVVNCCNMVFCNDEDSTEWWMDCCEWDFRVYASVAFDNGKLL